MNEFTLGTCVGMVQTVVGHPLDTIKTNCQNNQTLKYNPTRLYRGLSYPLFSTTAINGLLFYSNDYVKSNFVLEKYNNNYISGFITGFVCSPVINVFETYKVRRQLNDHIDHKNVFNYIKSGMSATLLRESFGTGLYFGTYYYLRDKYNPFISGSIAGVTSWFFTYPIDVIKTRLQSGLDSNWKDALERGNLTRGLSICLLRSFIVNGLSFVVYEYIKEKSKLNHSY